MFLGHSGASEEDLLLLEGGIGGAGGGPDAAGLMFAPQGGQGGGRGGAAASAAAAAAAAAAANSQRFHDFPLTPMDEEGMRLRGIAMRRGKPETDDSEVREGGKEGRGGRSWG